jgi:UPF0042 nucleotide-binding protein
MEENQNLKAIEENQNVRIVIITGLSGAGKTAALRYFEDAGYYCIDNLPASLLTNLIDFFQEKDRQINKIAVAIDLRSGFLFDEIYRTLDDLKKQNIKYRTLYLEASKSEIVKRFALTRRKHPLVDDGDIISGSIIDTTSMTPKELKLEIAERFMNRDEKSKLFRITVVSFGYKYGIHQESLDIVMDVRFLPNPFYITGLRELDGTSDKVRDFVMSHEETRKFLRMFEKMLDFLIPNYIEEGKSYLGIGIGCTGGRHRSVVMSEKLYEFLKLKGYSVKLIHRDIEKGED